MSLVEAKDLTKAYGGREGGESVPVLSKANLEIAAGETVAIVGPSGSGKSTLLNIIGTLDRADSGQLLIDGRDIERFSPKEAAEYRNTTIGFIFQLHHLMPQCTVLENVLIPTLAIQKGDRAALSTRAEGLVEAVGLKERMHHRPGELSGGERQRAAVARALINSPKLLLADEPTGALDRASAERLMALLLQIHREHKVTVLLVTHALDYARQMGRALELRDGKLVSAALD